MPAPLATAGTRRTGATLPVELLEGAAEEAPLGGAGVDAVVTTRAPCSIGDPARAPREARRVPRYGGEAPFVEHGRAPEAGVRGWQDRLTPARKHVAGSRRLDRAIDGLVLAARFRPDDSRTGYSRGPKPTASMYEGQAGPG